MHSQKTYKDKSIGILQGLIYLFFFMCKCLVQVNKQVGLLASRILVFESHVKDKGDVLMTFYQYLQFEDILSIPAI